MNTSYTVAYLADLGLDAYDIVRDGITDQGYYEFLRDDFGVGIWDQARGETARRWREWPEGFDPVEFNLARAKDRI